MMNKCCWSNCCNGNEMGRNCEERKHVEGKHERDEMQDEIM